MPAALRFVGAALTDWGCADLVDDVGLCVTELSTNATVRDTGDASGESIAARSAFIDVWRDDLCPDELPDGKRVWAEFAQSNDGYDAVPRDLPRRRTVGW